MITSLLVKNFRSLRDIHLDLRSRNVLIGANKSGKSTLLEALKFLRHVMGVGDVVKPVNDRGGLARIVWGGRAPSIPSVSQPQVLEPIEFQLHGETRRPGETTPIIFSYQLTIGGDLRGQIAISREILDLVILDSRRRLIDMAGGQGVAKKWDLNVLFENPTDQKKPALAYDIPGWEAGFVKSEIVAWQFFDLIPQVAKASSNTAAAVAALDEHGGNLSSWIHTLQVNYPDDFNRVAKLFRDAFPEVESLGTIVTQAGTTFITSREKFLQSPITVLEASAGELKFLALMSLIFSPVSVPLVCVEEPENNLNPRLLSLLVEMANQRRTELGDAGAQVIVTTHSPYLVDLLEPEDVVLVSKDEGATLFRRPGSEDDLRRLMRQSETTLGRLWFSGSLEAR